MPYECSALRVFLLVSAAAVGAGDTLTALREDEVVVEVLSSRVLLHPVEFERSFRFYI